jgi:CBS domain-containing protein
MLLRTVRDAMTQVVVTAHPRASFAEVARLLYRNGVTAVPVVDDSNHLLGMVSETDLLREAVLLPDPQSHCCDPLLPEHDLTRGRARSAAELMVRPDVVARPDWSIVQVARVMADRRTRRLPVVDDTGHLVGIVSRSDLLRRSLRSDTDIRDEIVHGVLGETLGLTPGSLQVAVHDGVVTLAGGVGERSLIRVIERLCGSLDGVVAVHHTLSYEFDDMNLDLGRPQLPETSGSHAARES